MADVTALVSTFTKGWGKFHFQIRGKHFQTQSIDLIGITAIFKGHLVFEDLVFIQLEGDVAIRFFRRGGHEVSDQDTKQTLRAMGTSKLN